MPSLIFNAVLPIFGFIALGYGLARTPVLRGEAAKGLSQFVFFCAIPALLFRAGTRIFGTEPLSPDLLLAFFAAGVGLHLVAAHGRQRFRAGDAAAGHGAALVQNGRQAAEVGPVRGIDVSKLEIPNPKSQTAELRSLRQRNSVTHS